MIEWVAIIYLNVFQKTPDIHCVTLIIFLERIVMLYLYIY